MFSGKSTVMRGWRARLEFLLSVGNKVKGSTWMKDLNPEYPMCVFIFGSEIINGPWCRRLVVGGKIAYTKGRAREGGEGRGKSVVYLGTRGTVRNTYTWVSWAMHAMEVKATTPPWEGEGGTSSVALRNVCSLFPSPSQKYSLLLEARVATNLGKPWTFPRKYCGQRKINPFCNAGSDSALILKASTKIGFTAGL